MRQVWEYNLVYIAILDTILYYSIMFIINKSLLQRVSEKIVNMTMMVFLYNNARVFYHNKEKK